MNLILCRRQYLDCGVFGELSSEDGQFIGYTLEHSYDGKPKLPVGFFNCSRGPHRLASMKKDFETFEILNVPGHKGILFHMGNFNEDSSGCVLLGDTIGKKLDGTFMLMNSKVTFLKFMKLQEGVSLFTLRVE